MIGRLLFLFSIFFVVFSTDLFTFNVSLRCQEAVRKPFSFKMKFVDEDWMLGNGDDDITKVYSQERVSGGWSNFTIQGTMDGDEHFSKYYTVKMLIIHDCTREGKQVLAELKIHPEFQIFIKYPKHFIYNTNTVHISNVEGKRDHTSGKLEIKFNETSIPPVHQ